MKETYLGCIEVNENVIYLTHDNDFIYESECFNAGFAHYREYAIDPIFSLDENIQSFVELLEGE